MRDYSKVSPQFWNGKTGKALKAQGPEAVIVGLYLMTCQHANMLGLYYLSPTYIAVDTGLGLEGANKGLARACEAGFCGFDEGSEVVWVYEMARYQIGDSLEAKDNRCKGVQREYDALPDNPFLGEFFHRYAESFHMTSNRGPHVQKDKPLKRGSKAPTKPRTGAGERTGAEAGAGGGAAEAASPTKGTRLPDDWQLSKAWGEWALAEFPLWTDATVRTEAARFADYWHGKSGKDATKCDWEATWRNWCRDARRPVGLRAAALTDKLGEKNAEAARLLFGDQPETLDA